MKVFIPAIPPESSVVVPRRFYELRERVTAFDPSMRFRRVHKGSFCPGQISLWGGDTGARDDLP
jgi:hypothetical protein